MAEEKKEEKKKDGMEKYQGPLSDRFTAAVLKEFGSTAGLVELTPFQHRLAQHLFIKIDTALQEFEKKRAETDKEGLPIVWANINMTKLALSAMDRIELGLDALIPNHIWPIPYLNKRLGKYDLDLRVGFVGKDYYVRKMAMDPPKGIVYELVYSTDKFAVTKKSENHPVETYEFEITTPFDRGEVVGGFGYISYDDPTKNQIVLVSLKDFEKSKKLAKSDKFWQDFPTEMKLKTLIHRVTGRIRIDPEKVNAAYLRVEAEEELGDAHVVQTEISKSANKDLVVQGSDEAGQAGADQATGQQTGQGNEKAAGEGKEESGLGPGATILRRPAF